MRFQLPDVLTIELNDDPAGYIFILDQQGPFEATLFSDEDTARTIQYKENLDRDLLKASVSDYKGYLASWAASHPISAFNELRLDRVTQLINKTNQFNLTTLRKTRSEVEAIMRSDNCMSVYVQLTNKFGDNGIIGVVYGTWG
jgi:FkbH-like protein